MTYKLINKNILPTDKVEATIEREEPYTFITRTVQNGTDESIIQAVLDQLAMEADPTGALNKLEEEIIQVKHEALEEIQRSQLQSQMAIAELMATLGGGQ